MVGKTDVIVIGRLPERIKYNSKVTRGVLNISPNKKIVLLATNQVNKIEDRKLVLETLKAIKGLDNVQLIIKLHPGENTRLAKGLARKTKTNPIIIPHVNKKDIKRDEIISVSDLVIICYSTVGLDALRYEKPLIAVNFSGKPDEEDYVEEGVALGVYHPKDLQKSIKLLLYNQKERKKLLKKAKPFVKARIDCEGEEAMKRMMSEIKEIIK